MTRIGIVAAALCGTVAQAVIVTVDPWVPLYQGVDLGHGQQQAQVTGERNHQVLCLRIDLTNPDIRLFTTPHCTNSCGQDTLSENASLFLENYGLQVVVNGAFYESSAGPNDQPLGTPYNVEGLAISLGDLVSPADDATRATALLFTTNNQAIFLPTNAPPGTNTAGIYTAISGDRPELINGVNVQTGANTNDLDPRTAMGLSQDRRYLYLMTIDGRQPGWSDGADFSSVAEWLKRFGAWDGINVDGGGSTIMCMADACGKSVRLNRSSFVFTYGRERRIGHHFGVWARPLPRDIADLNVAPGSTTATITWRTMEPATTQVEYGLTTGYGSATPLDSRLLRNHAATLSGLVPGSNYFFRVVSTTTGSQTLTQACQFSTVVSARSSRLFAVTNRWSYTTNNLDGVNWKAPNYVETGWLGSGRGLLYVQESSAQVQPRNTPMPPTSGAIPRTYYFRSGFNFTGSVAGVSLTFSNFIDDGAVFYLNGTEITRIRMPAAPTVITAATVASAAPCSGDATCPDVFTLSGPIVETNLVQGTNVLAVEVHNQAGAGTDLVFGSALYRNDPVVVAPRLNLWMEAGDTTIFWNGEGFTLEQSADLSSPANWSNAPGAAMRSPFITTNAGSLFYRLKN